MKKTALPKTKKITVELPIECWLQLYEMQGVGLYRKMTVNKIARQFIIERLDKERPAAKKQEDRRHKIRLTDIGINVDGISGKKK